MDFIRTKYIFFVKTTMTCKNQTLYHVNHILGSLLTQLYRFGGIKLTTAHSFSTKTLFYQLFVSSHCVSMLLEFTTRSIKKFSFNRSPLNFRKYTPSNTIGLVYVSHVTYGSSRSQVGVLYLIVVKLYVCI